MKLFTAITLISTLIFSSLSAHEGPWTSARPDGHAPISVMGDHMHAMGEWMVSYRYMTMDMRGLLNGSNEVSKATATSNYSFGMMGNMLPKTMTMDMHMFGLMYAPSDKLTLMLMTNYIETSMTMANGMGVEAMSMKMPVITTDVPGCRETVQNGDNGFLVELKSIEELAINMEKFIKDPNLVAEMGQKSYEMVCEKLPEKSTYLPRIQSRWKCV